MDTRESDLRRWAAQYLGLEQGASQWQTVAGDASARRYFRLRQGADSWIAVDAPPASEKNPEFLAVRALLANAGVLVPALLHVDLDNGFLLLGDLGDQLLLPLLAPDSVDAYYGSALQMLAAIQAIAVAQASLPVYDRAVLREELQRFPEWFVGGLLQFSMPAVFVRQLQDFTETLIDNALQQPQVLVHRDFHSRNLMLQPGGGLGVIDFQDAVIGPFCYDLVSLLRDCYIRWPVAQVRAWALAYYRQQQAPAGLPEVSDAQFMRWFDLIGLQRHLKVLGNFARLSLRDNRDSYLRDIPLVLAYIAEVLAEYPEFAWLSDWFAIEVQPWVSQQAWAGPV